ncbi:hypothetical protein TNCV_2463661 [Trichonephila clavipes]|nr:hypothetical protein TNCV_2463661 [Trichonephila clavipes]
MVARSQTVGFCPYWVITKIFSVKMHRDALRVLEALGLYVKLSRTRRGLHCSRGPGTEPSLPMPEDVPGDAVTTLMDLLTHLRASCSSMNITLMRRVHSSISLHA